MPQTAHDFGHDFARRQAGGGKAHWPFQIFLHFLQLDGRQAKPLPLTDDSIGPFFGQVLEPLLEPRRIAEGELAARQLQDVIGREAADRLVRRSVSFAHRVNANFVAGRFATDLQTGHAELSEQLIPAVRIVGAETGIGEQLERDTGRSFPRLGRDRHDQQQHAGHDWSPPAHAILRREAGKRTQSNLPAIWLQNYSTPHNCRFFRGFRPSGVVNGRGHSVGGTRRRVHSPRDIVGMAAREVAAAVPRRGLCASRGLDAKVTDREQAFQRVATLGKGLLRPLPCGRRSRSPCGHAARIR